MSAVPNKTLAVLYGNDQNNALFCENIPQTSLLFPFHSDNQTGLRND